MNEKQVKKLRKMARAEAAKHGSKGWKKLYKALKRAWDRKPAR